MYVQDLCKKMMEWSQRHLEKREKPGEGLLQEWCRVEHRAYMGVHGCLGFPGALPGVQGDVRELHAVPLKPGITGGCTAGQPA